jgi:DNA-binding transcriptional MocR family regulator
MPSSVDSLELYEKALQRGISFAPGPLFSAAGDCRNFIRLNCAVPWSDPVEAAVGALGAMAKEMM